MAAMQPFSEPVRVGLRGGVAAHADVGFSMPPPLPLVASRPVLVSESLIIPEGRTHEGVLIKSNSAVLRAIIARLGADWSVAFQLNARQWEELMAGVYSEAGYEVTLTPQSGDHGRDLIAVRRGFGCFRVLGSVKRYSPEYRVPAEAVRSLIGAVNLDPAASKGVITTTSDFAPRVLDDPGIRAAVPTRVQLINGEELQKLFVDLERGEAEL